MLVKNSIILLFIVSFAFRFFIETAFCDNEKLGIFNQTEQPSGGPNQSKLKRVFPAQPPIERNIQCSILKEIKFSIEVQPQWKQEKEFLLQVNLIKPLGETYLVTPLSESFILFVDNHPWALSPTPKKSPTQRLVRPEMGSSHDILRFFPDIPKGSEIYLEWISYNVRTRQVERLLSNSVIVE